MGIQEQMNTAVAQVATNYGEEYVKNIRAALSKKDKIASGALYNSINSNVTIEDNGVHLQILYLQYLEWIDMGRRPGKMPPVDAILAWIQARQFSITQRTRKNMLGRFSRGFKRLQGRDTKGKFTSVESVQRQMAWAIAMGIKKNGIQPVPILKDANDKLYGPMQEAATDAAVDIAAQYLGENFAEAVRQAGLQIITTH